MSDHNKLSNSKSYFQTNYLYIISFFLGIGFIVTVILSPSINFASLPSLHKTSTAQKATKNITTAIDSLGTRPKEQFGELIPAFKRWDSEVGCPLFKEKYIGWKVNETAVQDSDDVDCSLMKTDYISILAKQVAWVPDILDGLYYCKCGLSCLWTRNEALADQADIWLFQNAGPPPTRKQGEPLRAFMELEAYNFRERNRVGSTEDIFVSYHSSSEVQATYAGKTFRMIHSYHVAPKKRDDVLVYWSSSRCFQFRDDIARSLFSHLSHHSFGKCENNVNGSDVALEYYPDCQMEENPVPHWWDHLHCAMSHYKFVLAIENSWTESYITEKLFYALDSGSVPIYYGAPNVWDFVPPNSIIDASKFKNVEELAAYVKAVGEDPVAYAEFHAWRRCGVLGNYAKVRSASLDTLPCRMCEYASRKGGRNAPSE